MKTKKYGEMKIKELPAGIWFPQKKGKSGYYNKQKGAIKLPSVS
jgi:hypothetical protein